MKLRDGCTVGEGLKHGIFVSAQLRYKVCKSGGLHPKVWTNIMKKNMENQQYSEIAGGTSADMAYHGI